MFPCRLLLDLPNWLGDFVHALPALKLLLEANRGGCTSLLLPETHVPLAQELGVELIPRPYKAALAFAQSLPRPDVAVTFRHSTRAKLLLWRLRAAKTLASEGRGAEFFGLETFPVDRSKHQRHDMDGALARLRLPPVNGEPVGLNFSGKGTTTPGPVVLLPGSRSCREKRYPKQGFAQVARVLKQWGLEVVVVVGPSDRQLGAWVAREGGARLFPPGANLGEVAGFLHRARIAVGNDSGLTHLVAALGRPTLALFGPTSPRRTGPIPGWVLQAPDFPRLGWAGLPSDKVLMILAQLLAGDLRVAATMPKMYTGGGPLAQLAEQGTLNP